MVNPVDIICGLKILEFEDKTDAVISLSDSIYGSQVHGELDYNAIPNIIKIGSKFYKPVEDIDFNRYDKQYYFIENIHFEFIETQITFEQKGVIELLWDVFGGTINSQGYKVLDSHIGAIYGDSITLDRAEEICERLKTKGFASTNIVLGVGSFSLGYATRDQQGGAVKSTAVEINGELVEIYKDPITDDGLKKSAKGLLGVFYNESNILETKQQLSWEEANTGELKLIFKDGLFVKLTTLTKN